MIYLTGDTHAVFDRIDDFCRERRTTREDILIILGDAGINYFLGNKAAAIKEHLAELPLTFFCIHGNHEQRPFAIKTYRETLWSGAAAYVEDAYPSLLFAKDGEIYDFDGKKAIAIGGAYSVDKFYRQKKGYAWYDNEQPSPGIKKYVEEQLDRAEWKVDYVLSHTLPLKYEPVDKYLPFIDQSMVDKSTEIWLEKIEEKLDYQRWYCGHYHTSRVIDRLRIMFEDYAVLGE